MYADNDVRRDSGFQYFLHGNQHGCIVPLIVGTVGFITTWVVIAAVNVIGLVVLCYEEILGWQVLTCQILWQRSIKVFSRIIVLVAILVIGYVLTNGL
jgi:hypothetical protein